MFVNRDVGAIDRSPGDDFWYKSAGIATASGVNVSVESSLALTAVYACVRVLAESVAQLPLFIYQREGDKKSRALEHPLYRLLYKRPNVWQTSFEWREMMVGHVALRGNAYSEIVANGSGIIEQLIPMNPGSVTPRPQDSGEIIYDIKDNAGEVRTLTQRRVFHIRGMSSDGYIGISPIEMERQTIGMSLAAQDYGARFYKNDARPGGWIEYPGTFQDGDQKDRFKDSWQDAQTGVNRGRTAILERGMKYHEIAVSNEDAQFIETRRFQVEDIARIFRVPPHKIGHLDKATNNNIEHQGLEFVTDTLMPWLVRFEQAISRDLITPEQNDEFFAEFLVDSLLRGDTKSRYESYALGIQNSIITPNEARVKENLDPLPGLDETLQPLNMGKASEREQALSLSAARVVAKKELHQIKSIESEGVAEFYELHAEYVSRVMSVTQMKAWEYCQSRASDIKVAIETEDLADVFSQQKVMEQLLKL